MHIFIPLTLALSPMPSAGQLFRCDIMTKYLCDAKGGCLPAAVSVWNIIDVANQTISRCDGNGCDSYPAQFEMSGAFTNITAPKVGLLAKVSNDGRTFTEIATLADTILLSFGSCIVNVDFNIRKQ